MVKSGRGSRGDGRVGGGAWRGKDESAGRVARGGRRRVLWGGNARKGEEQEIRTLLLRGWIAAKDGNRQCNFRTVILSRKHPHHTHIHIHTHTHTQKYRNTQIHTHTYTHIKYRDKDVTAKRLPYYIAYYYITCNAKRREKRNILKEKEISTEGRRATQRQRRSERERHTETETDTERERERDREIEK